MVSKLTLPSLGERSNSSQPYRRAAPDCYRAEWDKLDPNGHAHHFVMVSPSGSTQDLDAVVDKKVRTACKSQASDAKLTGLLKQVAAARSTFFAATSQEVSARFAAAP